MHARFGNYAVVSSAVCLEASKHIIFSVVSALNLVFWKLAYTFDQIFILALQHDSRGWENSCSLLVTGREVLFNVIFIIFWKFFFFLFFDEITGIWIILWNTVQE